MNDFFGLASFGKERLKYGPQDLLHAAGETAGAGYSDSWSQGETGVVVRWSTRVGGFSDCLPINNENSDITLFFFGEDLRDRKELDILKGRGHVFNKRNASSLVHYYEDEGISFLERLNGVFCGLLVDGRKRKTYLFTDRFGLKRIYYHHNGDELLFSTRVRDLLRTKAGARAMDTVKLGEFLSIGGVQGENTLFSGVNILPPAGVLEVDPGGEPIIKRYFDPASWENQTLLNEDFLFHRLKAALKKAVELCIQGDDDVALSLTGGVDSRIILGCAGDSANRLTCITFGSQYRENSDVAIAGKIASLSGLTHRVITVGGEFLEDFEKWASEAIFLSSGTADVTGSAELFANEKAAQIAPVRITGSNGSELLKGVRFLQPRKFQNSFLVGEMRNSCERAVQELRAVNDADPVSFTLFRETPMIGPAVYSLEDSKVAVRLPFMDRDVVQLLYRLSVDSRTNRGLSHRLIRETAPPLAKIPTDRGKYPAGNGLMQWPMSLLMEGTFKLEYLSNYGMPQKAVFWDTLLGRLSPARWMLGRHKFSHFRLWYRNELAAFVEGVLLERQALERPYWEKKAMKKLVLDHIKGKANNTTEITLALTVELIHRHLLDA